MGQTTTAGYNARCNGAAERMGQRLIKMLTQTLPIPQSWVDRLPFVLFSYNLTPHRETGESPFFLLFFRDANFPTEVVEALLPTPYSVDIDDFRAIMMQNIGNTVEHVRGALERARERAKRYYDAKNKVNPMKYKVGHGVMVLDPGIGTTSDKKLHWRFFGPFRIAEISDNNARVYPIDKPHMEPQLVPLDRLSPVPAEVPNFSYAGKPDRARIVTSCTLPSTSSNGLIVEFDDGYELATFPTSVYEHIVLQEAVGTKPRRVYESDQKQVLLVNLMDESGLGPYWVCNGSCSQRCTPVLVRDVLPVLGGPEGEAKVPTLAHQAYLAHAQKFVDEADLPAVVRKLLEKAPAVLSREFSGVLDEATSEAPLAELIAAQAHLRRNHCYRVRTTLGRFPSIPIKAFADNSDDHVHFTAAVYSAGISVTRSSAPTSGGKKVTSGAFWALCPPGDEPLYRSDIVGIKTVKDLNQTLFELRSSVFDGTVQCVIVGLPPASKECPARLQQLLQLAESAAFDHVSFYIVPPPPSLAPSYASVIEQLLDSQESELIKVSDPGRSLLEVGRFGNQIDRRLVEANGRWSLHGLNMVRTFIVDVKELEWLRRDRLVRELAPLPPKPPKPPARLQSVVVVPPPRVSSSQGTLAGRPFRPAGGGRSGEPHRQSSYADRHRRGDDESNDQKRRRY
ncbi:gagpol and env protein precursor [Aphelenchoides avenae]|nr:gagpol and env protein precursor [Aphelenchus avenae]